MNSPLKEVWAIILDSLSKKYSEEIMKLWFNHIELVYLDDKSAFLVIDEPEFVDLLNKRYSDQISLSFKEKLDLDVSVKIFDKSSYSIENAKGAGDEADVAPAETDETPQPENKPEQSEGQNDEFYYDEPSVNPDSAYTFDNFVVGNSNKFAYAASIAIAKHPYANENNPLFIYGSSGLGKTHLMKAIANAVFAESPKKKIIFVSGENFTNEFLDSLANKTMTKFREKYRSVDILFVDDIQFIAGRTSTEEEFFNTFNAIHDAHKQIVLTSDRLPQEIPSLEKRLVSRFEGGLIADIQPPDTELRIAILKSKAMALKVEISNEVLTYIAENTKSSVRQIEGVIKRLGAYKLLNGTQITIENAKSALHGIISGNVSPSETAEKIIGRVSEFYNIPVQDIKSKRRQKEIAQARHVSIYIINHVTTLTLDNIGKIFGRDHSTVLSSINVITRQIKSDASFEHDINSIIKEFS